MPNGAPRFGPGSTVHGGASSLGAWSEVTADSPGFKMNLRIVSETGGLGVRAAR